MDDNVSSCLYRAFETQITMIGAQKILRQRTWVDRFIDKKTNPGIFNTRVQLIERSVREIVGEIRVRIVERLLYSKNIKLQNYGVSKQRSHNTVILFSTIVLKCFQVFNHISADIVRAMFEAVMMLTERGCRQKRA
jgi:hypothetical protein